MTKILAGMINIEYDTAKDIENRRMQKKKHASFFNEP